MTVLAVDAEVEHRTLPPSMVERMTLILEAFPAPSTRRTLEDVSRVTGLPRSTAHRILEQLVRLEWLDHTGSGYALGGRSLALGGAGAAHLELRSAAAPALHELQVRTSYVAHLAVLEDDRVHYLDKVGGRFAASVPSRVGGRAPAHCTALGRAMLAWLPAEEVDALLPPRLPRPTPQAIGDRDALHVELARIRTRHGIAVERQEACAGIVCVAAAVRGPDGPIGAISVVGDLELSLDRVAPLVARAARATTHRLFPELQPAAAPRRRRRGPVARVTAGAPVTAIPGVGDLREDDWF
jgi:DNA-binding IclR family transcriptional regulator